MKTNMKKKIIGILALALAVVTAVVLFTTTGKKAEARTETAEMTITIVNKTGETVKDLTLKEQAGTGKQALTNGVLADKQEITVKMNTPVESGAPFINFSYALESGNWMQTSIMTKGDKIVTLTVGEDGSPMADIVTK